MASAFWERFKPLYAVDTLEGYTENEITYLKELFGILPHSNEPDNMVAAMDCGDWGLHGDGELQMLYGAASEASYARLMSALEGIGEAI